MMKQLKRMIVMMVALSILMIKSVYASTPTWEDLPGKHNESILLNNGETYSEDEIKEYARGVIFSAGILRISNEEDGTLHISVDTAAHRPMDKIYQTVFLDMWDESQEDWVQIGKWDFERSKEEVEGDLTSYHVGFIVPGCEVNRYYRARAMHLVQLGNDYEGKSTETDGVLLTDHEV